MLTDSIPSNGKHIYVFAIYLPHLFKKICPKIEGKAA